MSVQRLTANGATKRQGTSGGAPRCQYELNAPRHFLYPALLLLLSEEPRHGYRLVDAVLRLGFGAVDRPSVYRALADLEGDGLLRSWDAVPIAGSTRHVYAVTDEGHAALHRWMGVIAEEQACLDRVLARFDAVNASVHASTNGHNGNGHGANGGAPS